MLIISILSPIRFVNNNKPLDFVLYLSSFCHYTIAALLHRSPKDLKNWQVDFRNSILYIEMLFKV